MGSRGRSEACSGFTRSPGVRPTEAVGYGGLEQTQDLATEAGHSKNTRVTIRTASGNSISAHEPEGPPPSKGSTFTGRFRPEAAANAAEQRPAFWEVKGQAHQGLTYERLVFKSVWELEGFEEVIGVRTNQEPDLRMRLRYGHSKGWGGDPVVPPSQEDPPPRGWDRAEQATHSSLGGHWAEERRPKLPAGRGAGRLGGAHRVMGCSTTGRHLVTQRPPGPPSWSLVPCGPVLLSLDDVFPL
ncbi:unnamed protein product [Boreogadus saida]